MGNNLDSLTQIISFALLGKAVDQKPSEGLQMRMGIPKYLLNNALVDLTSGNVVVATKREVDKALVVAKIKISLAAIIKNEHL